MRSESAPGRVIVVLGYAEIGADGSHGISAICREGVRRAEALAARELPSAVVLTGWTSSGGPSEAEQMAAAWQGRRDVPLLVEPLAVNTAENAARSLRVIAEIDGASEVVVVCSIRHALRVPFFFDALYRRLGYAVAYRYVTLPAPSLRLWRAELSSITRMARDRRAALRLLGERDRPLPAPQNAGAHSSSRPPSPAPIR
jgi:uncharacterized SAM-binding protein YcdF (DUF218 family)